MDYEQKFLMFRRLANKTFPNIQFGYNINHLCKLYQLIICKPKGYYFILIKPEIKWHQIKKKIEEYIVDFVNPDCFVCLEQITGKVNYCEKCSLTICDDCVYKIILNDNMYHCPQCRHIPPHYISKDPNLDKPQLSYVI